MSPAAAALLLGGLSFFVEVLTGNIRLAAHPPWPALALIFINYAAYAVLAREAAARWAKGFSTVVVLGLAYGLVNEGLCSKGIFAPHYYSVRALGLDGFGRVGGVNAVWALGLCAIHAALSVAAPVAFVDVLAPGTAGRLRPRALAALAALLVLDTALMARAFRPDGFAASPFQLAVTAGVVAALWLAAWALPAPVPGSADAPPRRALFAVGLAGMAAFVAAFGLRRFGPAVTAAATLAVLAWAAAKLRSLAPLPTAHRAALGCGVYAVPALAALRQGRLFVATAVAGLLVLVLRCSFLNIEA